MVLRHFKNSLVVLSLVGLFACAHKVKPVDIPLTANPTEETDSLAADVQKARQARVDVLAPDSFAKAEDKLQDALKRRSKEDSGEKILKSVALGRAYLNKASEDARNAEVQMAEVIKARDAAVAGGAKQYPADLGSLDRRFKKQSNRVEEGKKLDRDDLVALQAKYFDLELEAIKGTKLSEAENILSNAEKKGAKSLTPQAYAEAKEKLASAEKTIEVDRHDNQAVDVAVQRALESSRRTLALTETARENKKRSPEQVAREIEDRSEELNKAGAKTAAIQAQVNSKDRQIQIEKAQLSAVEMEKQRLEKKERFNRAFEQARSEFNANEAEVYRQGDNMIIRLKSMQFPSGRSELPSASMLVLNKVKGVISQLNTEEVVVEGHTDSIGSAKTNQDLSTKRASAVADYFVAENVVDSSRVEAVGFGDQKPISTNRSKEGRAQNRRVDIIIKPEPAAGTSVE